jgi:CRISPR-associated endonuclease/helicase Cas3
MLAEHVDQLRQAGRAIWERHSPELWARCAGARAWFDDGACLHDAGKASPPFQEYIADPALFLRRHRADTKVHTPLSAVCTLAYGKEASWDWQRVLAVAQIAAGHHSEFRTHQELSRALCCDRIAEVVGEQVRDLDWPALQRAIGLAVPVLANRTGVEIACAVADQLDELIERLHGLPVEDGVLYRLMCQLAYSVLLEADKAFLAVPAKDLPRYLQSRTAQLPPRLVETYVADKRQTPVTGLQQEARAAMVAGLAAEGENRVHTMTLPTGSGKTLLAATWALTLREQVRQAGQPPLVLIVLPYLAIIDQTVQEYAALLEDHLQPGEMVTYHSLSDRTFSPDLEDKSQDFFLDTWQSNVVITTFDQFLYALLSPRARHQMRFHHLADALVVMDEVQALPCVLWDPLRQALDALTRMGNTRLLAMSATQPGFLPQAHPLIVQPEAFFKQMKRYRLILRHRKPVRVSEFIDECVQRLPDWKEKRTLLTLNTRRSARAVRDRLEQAAQAAGLHVEFLTADVTPADRLAAIARVKQGGPCLVVSTQCIEAGVDIDMDFVVRDFAPLDSLIQVAGRCNRFWERERGIVEIVCLLDDDHDKRTLSAYVYDRVLLGVTHDVLGDETQVDEEGVFPMTERYFEELRSRKDIGEEVTRAWARWEQLPKSVRELLRGARPQVTFVVIGQDPELLSELEQAREKTDRWERRRALRRLAGRLARISVSIYSRGDFDPAEYAEPYPEGTLGDDVWFWLLKDGYYTPRRGIELGRLEHAHDSWGMVL